MITIQDTPHVSYLLYNVFDHNLRDYVISPSGNDLWTRAELFDAVQQYETVSLMVWNGLIYINFDAWGLQPGEVPGVHDFRASDAFVAGRQVSWEEIRASGAT